MKNNLFFFILLLVSVITICFSVIFLNKNFKNCECKSEPPVLKNDSIMLSEYQKAFSIFLEKDRKCALKFSNIMDSLNCAE